jgi:MFS family permease
MAGENGERSRLLDGAEREQRYDGQPSMIKAPNTDQEISRKDLYWIFAGTWSIVFLGALDGMFCGCDGFEWITYELAGTVVATLLTPIGSYFKKSNQASYLGTSYLLSVCCFTPLYGRLSDILGMCSLTWTGCSSLEPRVGRKGALLLAVSAFSLGTVLCGVATSMEMLIAARTIAGAGGGG